MEVISVKQELPKSSIVNANIEGQPTINYSIC